jgi:predicted RNA-binding Zn ribbon-like protein
VKSRICNTTKHVNNGVIFSLAIIYQGAKMCAAHLEPGGWVDGFLFVGNRPILDFLNTKPLLEQGPAELLPNFGSVARWLVTSQTVNSSKLKTLLRGRQGPRETSAFLRELIAFRERLRETVLRIERGLGAPDEFVKDLNARLAEYPWRAALCRRDGQLVMEQLFDPEKPADLWVPFIYGTADLLAETDTRRLRQCESCVAHFYDTSRKGSRRWCSMNICGNKLKVAAYRRRKRSGEAH